MNSGLREVGFILGATDGDVVSAARRLVKRLKLYQWAISELSVLVECSENKHLVSKKEEILNTLKESDDYECG